MKIKALLYFIIGLIVLNLLFYKKDSFYEFYNSGNSFYKNNKYNEALEKYSEIDCDENKKCSYLKHNVGNTYYRLSEIENDLEKKKELLEKSIDSYSSSLKISYDADTEANLRFVLDKLDKLKEESEQQKEEPSPQPSPGQGEGEAANEENSEKNQEGDSQGSENELSQEDKELIEQYEKELKESQGDIANSYNKLYEENNSPFDDFEAFFGKDPFFDNSLLEKNDDVKDW